MYVRIYTINYNINSIIIIPIFSTKIKSTYHKTISNLNYFNSNLKDKIMEYYIDIG